MYSKCNKLSDEQHISDSQIKEIIRNWTDWVKGYLEKGWDAYMVAVLFHQLAGSQQTMQIQMNQEIERVHNRLATRMVRKPRSKKWAPYLPIGFFAPDFPVPKSKGKAKSSIADVSINDGLHMGGIILANKWGRISHGLDEHFAEEKDLYERGKIRSIDVRPITYGVRTVVDYTFTSLKRRTSTLDDVLVLSWRGGTA